MVAANTPPPSSANTTINAPSTSTVVPQQQYGIPANQQAAYQASRAGQAHGTTPPIATIPGPTSSGLGANAPAMGASSVSNITNVGLNPTYGIPKSNDVILAVNGGALSGLTYNATKNIYLYNGNYLSNLQGHLQDTLNYSNQLATYNAAHPNDIAGQAAYAKAMNPGNWTAASAYGSAADIAKSNADVKLGIAYSSDPSKYASIGVVNSSGVVSYIPTPASQSLRNISDSLLTGMSMLSPVQDKQTVQNILAARQASSQASHLQLSADASGNLAFATLLGPTLTNAQLNAPVSGTANNIRMSPTLDLSKTIASYGGPVQNVNGVMSNINTVGYGTGIYGSFGSMRMVQASNIGIDKTTGEIAIYAKDQLGNDVLIGGAGANAAESGLFSARLSNGQVVNLASLSPLSNENIAKVTGNYANSPLMLSAGTPEVFNLPTWSQTGTGNPAAVALTSALPWVTAQTPAAKASTQSGLPAGVAFTGSVSAFTAGAPTAPSGGSIWDIIAKAPVLLGTSLFGVQAADTGTNGIMSFRGAQAATSTGNTLVGSQIAPGVYTTGSLYKLGTTQQSVDILGNPSGTLDSVMHGSSLPGVGLIWDALNFFGSRQTSVTTMTALTPTVSTFKSTGDQNTNTGGAGFTNQLFDSTTGQKAASATVNTYQTSVLSSNTATPFDLSYNQYLQNPSNMVRANLPAVPQGWQDAAQSFSTGPAKYIIGPGAMVPGITLGAYSKIQQDPIRGAITIGAMAAIGYVTAGVGDYLMGASEGLSASVMSGAGEGSFIARAASVIQPVNNALFSYGLPAVYGASVAQRSTTYGPDGYQLSTGTLGGILATETGPMVAGGMYYGMRNAPAVKSISGNGVTLPSHTFGLGTETGELTTVTERPAGFSVATPKGFDVPFNDMIVYDAKTGEMVLPAPKNAIIETPGMINIRESASLNVDVRTPIGGENPNIPVLDLRENLKIMGEGTGPLATPTATGVAGRPSDVLGLKIQDTNYGLMDRLSYNWNYAKTQLQMEFPTASFYTDYLATRTLPSVMNTMAGIPDAVPGARQVKPLDWDFFKEPMRFGKFGISGNGGEGADQVLMRPETITPTTENAQYSNAMFAVYRNAPTLAMLGVTSQVVSQISGLSLQPAFANTRSWIDENMFDVPQGARSLQPVLSNNQSQRNENGITLVEPQGTSSRQDVSPDLVRMSLVGFSQEETQQNRNSSMFGFDFAPIVATGLATGVITSQALENVQQTAQAQSQGQGSIQQQIISQIPVIPNPVPSVPSWGGLGFSLPGQSGSMGPKRKLTKSILYRNFNFQSPSIVPKSGLGLIMGSSTNKKSKKNVVFGTSKGSFKTHSGIVHVAKLPSVTVPHAHKSKGTTSFKVPKSQKTTSQNHGFDIPSFDIFGKKKKGGRK